MQAEELENKIQELVAGIDGLRRKHAAVTSRIGGIGDEVMRGIPERAVQIPNLRREQDALKKEIEDQETELDAARSELTAVNNAANRIAMEALLARMEARRRKIAELGRTMALELGQLHLIDRNAGVALLPPFPLVSDLDAQRFRELLEPIKFDDDKVWFGSVRALPVGYEHTVKIYPVASLIE